MATLIPEIQKFLDRLRAVRYPEASEFTPVEARANQALSALAQTFRPAIGMIEERKAPGADGELSIRVYRPEADSGTPEDQPLPVLVWFHGGGWVIGTLDEAELTCCELARDAQCVVISVEYRLAPETPFPGAFEDCLAVTQWVAGAAAELGIDASRIAIGGDSAGGNLAACVAVAARDRDLELRLQLLVYPIIAADFDTDSYQRFASGYHLLRNDMRWSWDHYTTPEQRRDPRVSPIEAELTGVAPTWFFAAEADILYDEGLRYTEALTAAHVPVERFEMTGAIHGIFTQRFDCSFQARAEAAAALRRAFSIHR